MDEIYIGKIIKRKLYWKRNEKEKFYDVIIRIDNEKFLDAPKVKALLIIIHEHPTSKGIYQYGLLYISGAYPMYYVGVENEFVYLRNIWHSEEIQE